MRYFRDCLSLQFYFSDFNFDLVRSFSISLIFLTLLNNVGVVSDLIPIREKTSPRIFARLENPCCAGKYSFFSRFFHGANAFAHSPPFHEHFASPLFAYDSIGDKCEWKRIECFRHKGRQPERSYYANDILLLAQSIRVIPEVLVCKTSFVIAALMRDTAVTCSHVRVPIRYIGWC